MTVRLLLVGLAERAGVDQRERPPLELVAIVLRQATRRADVLGLADDLEQAAVCEQ